MCDARLRPFPNETELICEIDSAENHQHKSTLRDYAYPGSETVITWFENDRRTYHGDWPGNCIMSGCMLPLNHRGNHAL